MSDDEAGVDLSSIMVDPEEPEDNVAQDDDFEPDFAPPEPDPYELAAQREAEQAAAERAAEEKYGQDRRRLILVIKVYLNEFPKQLETFKKHKLEKLKKEELEKLKQEIEYVMGQKQNINTAVNSMIMGINVLEQVALSFTPLKLSGTTAALAADEDAVNDMKCVAIKHMDLVHLEPESRLAMRVLTTAMRHQQRHREPESRTCCATWLRR